MKFKCLLLALLMATPALAGNVTLPDGSVAPVAVIGTATGGPISSSNPMPVGLPTGGATSTNQSTEITALGQLHTDMIAPTPPGTNAIGSLVDNSNGSASISSAVVVTGFPISTAGFNKLSFWMQTGFTGTIVVEGSNDGGTNWNPILMVRTDSTSYTQVISFANPATGNSFEATINYAQVRLRASVWTSGTGVVQWNLKNAPTNHVVAEQGMGNTANVWAVNVRATTAGGTPAAYVFGNLAASTSPQNVKASTGNVYAIDLSNNSASWIYFHLHNTAGTPTAGSGVQTTYGVAPGTSRTVSFSDIGVQMGTGIAYTITGGPAVTDTTTVTTVNSLVGTIHYN